MGKITHTHHIIPRHAGGTDDPDNLVELMPIDHAIAHKVRYGLYGDRADLWAYGAILDMFETGVEVDRSGENNPMYGKKHSEETRRNHSAFMKGRYVGKNHPMYGKKNPGVVASNKARMATERIHYCDVCEKGPMDWQNYSRWHKKCTGTS